MSLFHGPRAFVALPPDVEFQPLLETIDSVLRSHGIERARRDRDGAFVSASQIMASSDLVIADISGMDPSVMMDVGIALGMRKRIILLSRVRGARIPFDMAAIQVAVYEPEDLDSVRRYLEFEVRDAMAPAAAVS